MSVYRALSRLIAVALLSVLAIQAEAQSLPDQNLAAKRISHTSRRLSRYTKPLFPQSINQRQSPQPLLTQPTPSISAASLPELERQIFERVNDYRVQRGLRSLRMDSRISVQARAHSQSMALHQIPFGHTDFKRRVRQVDRIISSRRVSENVAYIFSHNDPAKRAFEGWLKSPAHRRAIEDNFSITGIGVAIGDRGAVYFTQIYLRPR